MSSWIYRKPEPTHVRGQCVLCFSNPQKKTSRGTYQAICNSCERKRYNLKNYGGVKPYRKYKLEKCERCGFSAEDLCQMDVHHKDGNHHNNDPNNLQTLCANCHRFVHFAKTDQPPLEAEASNGGFSCLSCCLYGDRLSRPDSRRLAIPYR